MIFSDPLAASDGSCVVDGKRRPKKAAEEGDPFCSTECCRIFYGAKRLSDVRRNANKRKPMGRSTRDLRKRSASLR